MLLTQPVWFMRGWWVRDAERTSPRSVPTPPHEASGDEPSHSSATRSEADTVLLARLHAGDGVAFDALYRTHAEALWAFARRYVRSDDNARDIVHDVFTTLWAKRTTWNPVDIKAYLFRAVLNQALLLGRRSGVVARAAFELVDSRAATGITSPADADAERASDAAWIARAVGRLPERARVAIRLRWYDDMSYAQVAQVLGVSEDAARMYVRRALGILREMIGSDGGAGTPE
jgi:RNA polymerase sigma-70 factor (ECF subfamily)